MRAAILRYLEKNDCTTIKIISHGIAYGEYETKRECNRMVAEGLIICTRRGSANYYGLAENFVKGKERIIQFLKDNPVSSSKQVAAGAKVEPTYASAVLIDLHKAGRATRKPHPVTKTYLYSHSEPLKFGCANPLTDFINERLRSVRECRA